MPAKENKQAAKKKTFERTYSEKKPVSKRTLIKQQGMTVEDFDEDKSGYRKMRTPKKQKRQEIQTVKIEHAVVTTQEIPLKVLSEKLGVSAVEITKRLFKEGIMNATPILLEPIATMKVVVPEKYTGDVMGDLNRRRGRVYGMNPLPNNRQEIVAEIPMAEVCGYSTDLRSMTTGIGVYSYEFNRYEAAPSDVQARVVEDSKKDK